MLYRFTIISDEVENFVRVIEIAPDATFLAFSEAILSATGYSSEEMVSFFLCNEEWEKQEEITLMEMDRGLEYDNFVMADTTIESLVLDEKQKLVYVFDMMANRHFFMELSEMVIGKSADKPTCIKYEGTPPPQLSDIFEAVAPIKTTPIADDFLSDETFDTDEISDAGLEDLNF